MRRRGPGTMAVLPSEDKPSASASLQQAKAKFGPFQRFQDMVAQCCRKNLGKESGRL